MMLGLISSVWVRVWTPLFRVAVFPKYGKVSWLRLEVDRITTLYDYVTRVEAELERYSGQNIQMTFLRWFIAYNL